MSSPSRSGVFQQSADERVERFTQSIGVDLRLFTHDIQGSRAHAQMLAKVGLLTRDECQKIEQTLSEIQRELERGEFPIRQELEDIHMHIEQALIDRLGDVGRKLHTARSRNDQVSTDLRLWCRAEIDRLDGLLDQLQKSFVSRCERDMQTIVPAYTHMQRAQPVLAPHYWLAYCEKFQRDRERLSDCRKRVDRCGLGAAAVAGTSLPIDRDHTAQMLGFARVEANSLDVSSDRDFALELAFDLALISEHLSGWAEEWIIWSTVEFRLITLPQAFCTGSSIMPQKVNPDVLELIRGKTARVIGNLQTLLVLVKGLPLAYNRDLQEDKPALFDSVDTVADCLELAAPIVREAQMNEAEFTAGLERGYLDATTLMEFMIHKGVPQRTAHHLVGKLVGIASERKVPLASLTPDDFSAAHPVLDKGVYDVLGVENAVKAFQSHGSTSPVEVSKQVEIWRQKLGL